MSAFANWLALFLMKVKISWLPGLCQLTALHIIVSVTNYLPVQSNNTAGTVAFWSQLSHLIYTELYTLCLKSIDIHKYFLICIQEQSLITVKHNWVLAFICGYWGSGGSWRCPIPDNTAKLLNQICFELSAWLNHALKYSVAFWKIICDWCSGMIPKSEKWQVYLKQVRNGTYTLASTKDCSWSPNNCTDWMQKTNYGSVLYVTQNMCVAHVPQVGCEC